MLKRFKHIKSSEGAPLNWRDVVSKSALYISIFWHGLEGVVNTGLHISDLWQSLAIFDNLWQSLTISGNLWQSPTLIHRNYVGRKKKWVLSTDGLHILVMFVSMSIFGFGQAPKSSHSYRSMSLYILLAVWQILWCDHWWEWTNKQN